MRDAIMKALYGKENNTTTIGFSLKVVFCLIDCQIPNAGSSSGICRLT